MTDMVEKVGFAICSPAGNHCKRLCGECRRMSRAAISALMEPTDGMIEAAEEEREHAKAFARETFAVDILQAMLKAALDD